jgi:DNA-directed RNA polymerase subunit RPC12/RpoP
VLIVPEFAAACREHDRHLRRLVAGLLVWAAAGVAAIGPLVNRVELPLRDRLGESGAEAAAAGLLLAGMFAVLAPIAWWAGRRMRRVPGSPCPRCGKLLAHPGARQRAVATRCCPHCGERVLTDPDPAPADVPLLPLAEVRAVERAGAWRAVPWFFAGFAALVLGMAAFGELASAVGRKRLAAPFARLFGDAYGEAALQLTAVLLVAVLFAGGMARFLVLFRRTERRPELRCPHCGGRLSVGLLRQTGNCGHCGRKAVADPAGVAGTPAGG